tara:strand:+ start:40 stop:639 length:600 start_codon:yes stop_codon:yes gene_type:complete
MYDDILEKAKDLLYAINTSSEQLWEPSLQNAHDAIVWGKSEIQVDEEGLVIHKHDGIKKEFHALQDAIKNLEDNEPNNHPIWRELQIDPYTYDDFTHLDGSYGDPDAGCEWYKFYWEREEVWVEFQIQVTIDNGRDWGSVWIDNWKSEEDTIKWLRKRGVDEDDEFTDDFLIDEAHGLAEIIPFNDGFIINKEKVYIPK